MSNMLGTFYAFDMETSPHEQGYAWWRGAFNEEQLAKLVEHLDLLPKVTATVDGAEIKEKLRNSKIAWVTIDETSYWIYKTIADVFKVINRDKFGFHLTGVEQFQYTT